MSLLEQASLVITPNAYKESVLYSVVPNTTLGDMTVVRATTATRVNASSLIESVGLNIPRIDYTNGSCPSLLVEPQRTNLLTYSEQFDISWTKQAGTVVTANQIISPDGTQNADLVVGTGSGIYQSGKTVPTINTKSIYLKGVSGGEVVILQDPFETVNITVCTLTTSWQRFTLTETQSGGFGGLWVNQIPSGGIYIWGAQLELGSYATSYIPTVATSVTRNADVISKTGISSLIGQTEGVLFVESAALFNDLSPRLLSLSNGTTTNRIFISYSATSNTITLAVVSAGITILNINYLVSNTTQFAKIAVRYSNTLGYSLWVNGVNRGSNALVTIPTSMSRLGFDNGAGGTFFFGKIKQVQLYKTALSNTEMATLTTL